VTEAEPKVALLFVHRSDCEERSSQDGVRDRWASGAEEEDSGKACGLEPVVVVALKGAVSDGHRAGTVVADKEDRASAATVELLAG
jgi:hypothetical protein